MFSLLIQQVALNNMHNRFILDNREQENESAKSDTESFAEVSESDLIALALSPNEDGANDEQKLVSLPSDSTLNSVSLTEVDGII